MRNLCTQFGKELGKVRASKVSGTSTSNVYNPTWKWFSLLVFLKDSITPVKTKPTPGVRLGPSTSAELDTADTAALQPEIEHADQETGQDADEHTSESNNNNKYKTCIAHIQYKYCHMRITDNMIKDIIITDNKIQRAF